MTCPRYVRTRTFHGGDRLWLHSTILCDPERGDAITTAG